MNDVLFLVQYVKGASGDGIHHVRVRTQDDISKTSIYLSYIAAAAKSKPKKK